MARNHTFPRLRRNTYKIYPVLLKDSAMASRRKRMMLSLKWKKKLKRHANTRDAMPKKIPENQMPNRDSLMPSEWMNPEYSSLLDSLLALGRAFLKEKENNPETARENLLATSKGGISLFCEKVPIIYFATGSIRDPRRVETWTERLKFTISAKTRIFTEPMVIFRCGKRRRHEKA
jgi:hypothetical protein